MLAAYSICDVMWFVYLLDYVVESSQVKSSQIDISPTNSYLPPFCNSTLRRRRVNIHLNRSILFIDPIVQTKP